MNPFDNNDEEGELGPGEKAFFKRLKAQGEIMEKLKELHDKESTRIETEILMPLWSALGDHTETYWEAIQAAGMFQKGLKQVRRITSGLPKQTKRLILKAIADCIMNDVEMSAVFEKKQEELEKQMEKELEE